MRVVGGLGAADGRDGAVGAVWGGGDVGGGVGGEWVDGGRLVNVDAASGVVVTADVGEVGAGGGRRVAAALATTEYPVGVKLLRLRDGSDASRDVRVWCHEDWDIDHRKLAVSNAQCAFVD